MANSTPYMAESKPFDLATAKKRIEADADMIANYTLADSVRLKHFMTHMHRLFKDDPRAVTMLTPEESATYFRGLALVGGYALEVDSKLTKPTTTARSRGKLIDDLDEDDDDPFDLGGDDDDATDATDAIPPIPNVKEVRRG